MLLNPLHPVFITVFFAAFAVLFYVANNPFTGQNCEDRKAWLEERMTKGIQRPYLQKYPTYCKQSQGKIN